MRRLLIASILAGLFGFGAVRVSADTVVRTDGASFTGEVTRTDSGISVKTKAGTVVIPNDQVDRIITGTPAATSVPSTGGEISKHPGSASPGVRTVDPKQLQALLDQGLNALSVGEYAACRDALSDVLVVDPKNLSALHGLAVAYIHQNNIPKAQEAMEKALNLSPAPDRALVLNAAVLEIAVRNPMRAAKLIKDYLSAHNKVLDEPMLNAMAVALRQAPGPARRQALYNGCVQFYIEANKQLEAAVPGQKRWGLEWMPADVVNKKLKEMADAQKKADQIGARLDDAEDRLADAQSQMEAARSVRNGAGAVMAAQRAIDSASNDCDARSAEYDAALAKIPVPSCPTKLSLVALNDLTPPQVGSVALAFADNQPGSGASSPPPAPLKPKPSRNGPKPPRVADAGPSQPPAPPPIEIVAAKPTEDRKISITSYAVGFPAAPHLVVTAAATLADASRIEVQTSDGTALKVELVRSDPDSGLALLRVADVELQPLNLAEVFGGGKIDCASYPDVNIFIPTGALISGAAPPAKEGWQVRLSQHPRLPGGPLLAGGKLVGVELGSRDSDPAAIPAATLEQLRKFLGADLPAAPSPVARPIDVLVQVLATRQSK